MLKIQCCKDCVPPKRYPGCSGSCPEYKKEKAEIAKSNAYIRRSAVPVLSEYNFNKRQYESMKKTRNKY